MRSKISAALAACFIIIVAGQGSAPAVAEPAAAPPAAGEASEKPRGWLMDAPDDSTRFNLIQKQLGGFSSTMLVVGQRYQALYDALGDKNYELAEYHWEKINEIIELGYFRRPKRQENADKLFVKKLAEPVMADIKSGDASKAWAAFAQVREGCMECHKAEKKAYMNDQPLFRDTAKPKE